jgi:AAA15 family ATPase/GTPase
MVSLQGRTSGVVLFDEIENGIHYHSMSAVWGSLVKQCRKNKVQLFATTHSRECLEAILPK